jgi:hypothetical protein
MASIDEGVDPSPYTDISGAVSLNGAFKCNGTVFYQSGDETIYDAVSNDPLNTDIYKWHVFNNRNLDQSKWNYMYTMIYTKLLSDPARLDGWRLKLDTNSTDILYHFIYRGTTIMYNNIFNDIPA